MGRVFNLGQSHGHGDRHLHWLARTVNPRGHLDAPLVDHGNATSLKPLSAAFLTTAFTTPQAFGFLVEYISTPKALVDTTPHYRPVGAYEFALWRQGKKLPSPIERYRNDPGALKLISQDQWTLDRPLYDIKATNTVVGAESDYFVQAQRRQNFVRRMIPHIFGWFTMSAAWIIIVVHLEWARHDLAKLSDDISIPSWVDGVIYGTVLIFWSFTFPQIIFQFLPPGFYWGTELIYCVLSLTAKLYLGTFLLINVRSPTSQPFPCQSSTIRASTR